jgi:hypothetical protein
MTGVPILLSPEGAAGIKEGAKTGLSAVVCGILFLVAALFGPVFEAVPAAGTSPVLLMVGLLLFQNVSRVDWKSIKDSAPAFVVLFFIPFTYSLIEGVLIGYGVYVLISLFTGDLYVNSLDLLKLYFHPTSYKIINNSNENVNKDNVEVEKKTKITFVDDTITENTKNLDCMDMHLSKEFYNKVYGMKLYVQNIKLNKIKLLKNSL